MGGVGRADRPSAAAEQHNRPHASCFQLVPSSTMTWHQVVFQIILWDGLFLLPHLLLALLLPERRALPTLVGQSRVQAQS